MSFKYTAESLRFEIIDKLVSLFKTRSHFSIFYKGHVEKLITLLLIMDSIEKKTIEFIYILNKLITEFIKNGDDVKNCQLILMIIRSKTVRYLNFKREYSSLSNIESLLRKGSLIVNDLIVRDLTINRNSVMNNIWLLREVVNSLITTFNMNKLLDGIENCISILGIRSCFISLYPAAVSKKKAKIPKRSKLIFACYNRKRIDIKTGGRQFETEKLIPEDIILSDKCHIWIFMPLFVSNENLGFIIFELAEQESLVYENLRGHISSAIKGALLYKEGKSAEPNCKKQ